MGQRDQGVPALYGTSDTVNTGLIGQFPLVAAKKTVPDNKHTTVIAIEVAIVLGVVNAMVGGRDKQPLQPSQFWNVLGMHPELVDEVEGADGYHHLCGDAQQKQRQVKQPSQQKPGAGLPQRRGQVVVLALVMRNVGSP